MRRTAAILFASLILLSGGFLQMHLHLCREDGMSKHAQACDSHTQKLVCCATETADDCCEDFIVYGISPKFGSVSVEKLQQQVFFSFYMHHFDIAPATLGAVVSRQVSHHPLIQHNRDILISQGVLII